MLSISNGSQCHELSFGHNKISVVVLSNGENAAESDIAEALAELVD